MKIIFWFGVIGLFLFEVANVYFIMPMPGSQRMNSIDLAYYLYSWRWWFRGLFGIMILAGLFRPHWHRKRKWLLAIPMLLLAAVIYMTNFKMAADSMFRQPKQFVMAAVEKNSIDSNRLVLGVTIN